jgi:hypothetical protein
MFMGVIGLAARLPTCDAGGSIPLTSTNDAWVSLATMRLTSRSLAGRGVGDTLHRQHSNNDRERSWLKLAAANEQSR